MKNLWNSLASAKRRFAICALALVAFAGGMAGCQTMDRMYDTEVVPRPSVPVATNVVMTTNFVLVTVVRANGVTVTNEEPLTDWASYRAALEAAATNADAKIQERIAPRFEVVMSDPAYVTNLVSKPVVNATIEATNLVPLYGGLASSILGLIYSGYRNLRNKKNTQAMIEGAQRVREFLQTVPQGQELDAKAKEILKNHQVALGVWPEIRDILDKTLAARTPSRLEPLPEKAPEPNPPHFVNGL